MAHSAVTSGAIKYGRVNYMIRAKLYKGLLNGSMQLGSLIDEERVKLESGCICAYCGATDKLSIDHILPQARGGENSADNAVFACRRCNSSKNDNDLLEWYSSKGEFPPLLILRRYLKLVYNYCEANSLLDSAIDSFNNDIHPFRIDYIPTSFPAPSVLRL